MQSFQSVSISIPGQPLECYTEVCDSEREMEMAALAKELAKELAVVDAEVMDGFEHGKQPHFCLCEVAAASLGRVFVSRHVVCTTRRLTMCESHLLKATCDNNPSSMVPI